MTENASNSFSRKNEKKCSFSQKMPKKMLAQSRKAYSLSSWTLKYWKWLFHDKSWQIQLWWIGSLHDPGYGINYSGTQRIQYSGSFKTKESRAGLVRVFFFLEVPLRYLRPSIIYSLPCDRIVQRKALWIRGELIENQRPTQALFRVWMYNIMYNV